MPETTVAHPFLRSSQTMATQIRSYEWGATSLGEPELWPEALKSAVSICLNSPNPILILWGGDYIQLYNDAYKQLIGNKHEIALGAKSKDTWPEAWHVIQPLMNQVFHEGQTVNLEDQHFPINRYGYLEDTYFTTTFIPLLSEGKIAGIFVNSRETTEKVLSGKKIEESEQHVRDIFMQAPMGIGIFEGMNMKITLANDDILSLWRRDESVIGKELIEALPEIKGQGFLELLQNVYTTGEAFYAYEKLAQLVHDDKLNDHYFNFVYAPVRENNKVTGVMVVATEVTAQVEAKNALQESEKRFRSLILEAPMATALYVGREMKIEVANNAMLELWDKDDSVLGKPLSVALPELEGQPFFQLLDNVYTTGKAYHTDMQSADLMTNGKLQRYWFNFTYKPLHDANGNVYAILNMAVDISKQVQLQQQKDEFLGIASHELKTPVTSIKAYAQVLHQMMKEISHDQERHMLGRMDKQINKLTNLIENLLDVTKIQAGKLEFNEVRFDFNTLVKEVVADMQAIVSTHEIELDLNDDAFVFADRERIEQVINNFISNAAKYSPNEKRIVVQTKKLNGTIICSVKDNGVGIPSNNLENIFDRFYQVDRENQHRFSGLGLGLYISAEIIRRCNGTIAVESEEGKGSIFSFRLNTVQ